MMPGKQLDQPFLAPGERLEADTWALLGVMPHPVMPLPDEAWLRVHSVAELVAFLEAREEAILRMQEDPLRHGHEFAVWTLMDAVCGFPWVDPEEREIASGPSPEARAELRRRREWCRRVRRVLLRQDEPVRVLLVNGGNRGGKSEWAAKRVIRLLMWKEGRRAWRFHQDNSMSVEYQQPLLYKYLPAELRTEKGIRKARTYVSYKQQVGFTENRFVLPNGSDCSLRYYKQEGAKIEGGEIDIAWCDELVPAPWVDTLMARVATRRGWLIITFTPVDGYTPTVKMFLEKAQVVRESVAFMLPRDGGAPEVELALRGEDVSAWIDGEGRTGQPAAPAGRVFERVPRVMRVDRRTAVLFLHSFDNPFGNPRELVAAYGEKSAEVRKMRFYGLATRSVSSRFPKFRGGFPHVVPTSAVPKRGTRYMVMDPCSGRNWAMVWALVDRAPVGIRIWIYREWPCPGKYVPGEGDMGWWAEPGDRHDGMPGQAQRGLGWGLLRYKREIYRLEGRRDWERAEKGPDDVPFRFDADDVPDYVAPRRARERDGGEDI